ncbi:unnamed protein product [Ceutorhynchus assimilis]|uniref:lysozyme n=1 Tax=Ceutorhynchus assimilis TaxID=467358 RepID=A0A9N9MAE6_9CUCU|nr:unnamed protein product [Ceutorhynchus assimilis]
MRQIFLILVLIICVTIAKVFERCEFAKAAKENGFNNLSMWTCIAHQESRLNSESRDGDNYGIFQISSEAWCGRGHKCEISCESLLDSDLTNDFLCAMTIYRTSGFKPWSSSKFCNNHSGIWLKNCSLY